MQGTRRKGLAAMLATLGGVAGAVGFADVSRAATVTFTNTDGNNDWLDANNWNLARVPTITQVPGDTVGTGGAAASTANVINLSGSAGAVLDVRFANSAQTGPNANMTLNVSTGGYLMAAGDDARFGSGTSTGGAGFVLGRTGFATATVNITGGFLGTSADDVTGLFSVGQNVNGTSFATAFLNISGGTVASAQNFVVGDGGNTNATGKALGYVMQTGGAITAGGAAGAGSVVVGNSGIGQYTISAGTLTQTGSGTNLAGTNAQTNTARVGFYVGRNANSTGTFVQTGGAVTISNGLYLADGNNTKGSFTVSGGTLSIAGEMRVAPSTVDVGNPTTLTGNTGTFSIVDHATPTITANSLVADTGGSTLNFTMSSAAGTTLLKIAPGSTGDGTAYDGIAHLSASTHVDVDNTGGFTPAAGSTYTLLTAGSITALPTLVSDGDAFDTSMLSIVTNGDGTQSLVATVAAMPEPGSLAALALGGVAMVGGRRRRSLRRRPATGN